RAPRHVGVEAQRYVTSDRRCNGADSGDILVEPAPYLELDRVEAGGDPGSGVPRHRLRALLVDTPGERHGVARAAAEELIDGNAVMTPRKIEERNLERGAKVGSAQLVAERSVDDAERARELERIQPDETRPEETASRMAERESYLRIGDR